MKRLAAVLVISIAGALALTVSPADHDFGRWAVNAASPPFYFRVTLPAGSASTDSINLSIVGADPGDFSLSNAQRRGGSIRTECGRSPSTPGTCNVPVEFWARSIGPKAARLQVVDKTGTIVTATLRGVGVAPLCTMTLVFCNYAHLYTGTFHWESDLIGEFGSNRLHVSVNVVHGVATCDGMQTDEIIDVQGVNRYTTTQAGTISGKGLIAVEFLVDSANTPVYRVTAACPSPQWPLSLNRPVQQAEFGKTYFEQSYDVASPGTGMDLVGSRSEPHPDTDSSNGVRGAIVVTWHLKRS